MTFDLAVWKSEGALSSKEAQAVYLALCDGEIPMGLRANDHVRAFKRDFYGAYPPADPEEPNPLCPEVQDPRDHGVVLTFGWSEAERVLQVVTRLSARHGLVCFDPQQGIVHHPPGLSSRPKPWWKFW